MSQDLQECSITLSQESIEEVQVFKVNQKAKRSTSKKHKSTGPAPKRAVGDIRTEQVESGAMFLQFMKRTSTGPPQSPSVDWKKIEEKGFHVTKDGCIIPYKQYWPQGHSLKASHEALRVFGDANESPVTEEESAKAERLGWPSEIQVSHLCHFAPCCNPLHLVREHQWVNLARNYCGLDGTCDCGRLPKCVRTYQASNVDRSFTMFHYGSKSPIKTRIQSLLPESMLVLKIESRNHYALQDKQQANKRKRKKAQEDTLSRTKANQAKAAKLAGKSAKVSDDEFESDFDSS